MSMFLLAPAALAALAALLLPLLIHLARRSEQRPTDFAALRWLRQKPRPRHRLRFDEWPLLLLRLLLLALLALWLARPMLGGSGGAAPWVAVVPGVDIEAARATINDPAARLHWLSPGSPALEQPAPSGPQPIASLLRQLDAELPPGVVLTVVVPEVLHGVDAERPRLSRAIEWRVLPGAMPAPEVTPPVTAPRFAVRHASDREDAVRYLRAAASAWQAGPNPSAEAAAPHFSAGPTSQPLDADTRWLAWLAPGALQPAIDAWVKDGGIILVDAETTLAPGQPRVVVWHDALGSPLVEAIRHGKGRVLRLTRPLAPATMPQLLEPEFPRQLRALFENPALAPTRVSARDYSPLAGGDSYPQAPRDLQPWLAMLIVLLLLLERWLATRRRRGVAP